MSRVLKRPSQLSQSFKTIPSLCRTRCRYGHVSELPGPQAFWLVRQWEPNPTRVMALWPPSLRSMRTCQASACWLIRASVPVMDSSDPSQAGHCSRITGRNLASSLRICEWSVLNSPKFYLRADLVNTLIKIEQRAPNGMKRKSSARPCDVAYWLPCSLEIAVDLNGVLLESARLVGVRQT
jgi:hypothetical protein